MNWRNFYPTRAEWRRSFFPAIRGSLIGSFFGTLPGTGQTVASFVGYALEKKVSRNKGEFGKGAIEVVVSFLFGNFFLLVLNIPLIGIWVRLLRVPHHYLYPTVIMMICVGVYGISNSLTDVWATLAFGIIGYVLRLFRFEPAPMLIGFVLGPMMEEFFRRAMLLSRGDPMTFIERPGSAALLTAAFILLCLSALPVKRFAGRLLQRT